MSDPAAELAEPVTTNESIPSDLVTEKSIADTWRIPVKTLAAIRQDKLRKKVHWEIVHYTICYTSLGVERLKDLVSEGALKPSPLPTRMELDLREQVKLKKKWKVVRIPPNPRMLLLQNMWSMEHIWIHVTRNRNFKRNLVIDDSELSEPDVIGRRHLTRRLPRTYGRW